MSRINSKKRKIRIKIREKRKTKLAKLRQQYLTAETGNKKEEILAKAQKLAPKLSQEDFLAVVKTKKETHGGK